MTRNPYLDIDINWNSTISIIKAGISKKQLSIALEPETASIYCQYLNLSRKKGEDGASFLDKAEEGTKFMVVDLGGTYIV